MKESISAEQIAGDLVRMHEKRINAYKQILHHAAKMELDIKSIFERIINESRTYVQQLYEKMRPDTGTKGELYASWKKMHAPAPVLSIEKKGILESCANDELVAINTYSIALSMLADHDAVQLLEEQQHGLKKIRTHIRKYHNAQ